MITRELALDLSALNQRVQTGAASQVFLRRIQTVKFRNFKTDGTIEFRSPVTAIVGKNGTGKSTVLFLAGSAYVPPPSGARRRTRGKTFNDFVPDSQKDKMLLGSIYGFIYGDGTDHRYLWHERKSGNPSRAGMKEWDRRGAKTDRKHRNMIFLGFEKTISNGLLLANHFGLSKKDIEGRLNCVGQNSVPLNADTIEKINYITGKQYGTIEKRTDLYAQLSEHCHGYVVDGQYSDIACGSGEIAIIRMVESILSAPGDSLILIDEPENGVHQIAQERLVEFIVDQAVRKGHQFIFTTHSDTILEQLGPDSIILLEPGAGERVIYPKNVNRAVAFKAISDKCEPKFTAIVEDAFAEAFLNHILQSDPTTRDLLRIKSADSDGWIEMVKKDFPKAFATYSHSHNAAKPVFVLDGDTRTLVNLTTLENELGTRAKLRRYYDEHGLINLIRRIGRLSGAGNNGISFRMYFKPHLRNKSDTELLLMIENYIDYFEHHLIFLPGIEPPEVVLCQWIQKYVSDSRSLITQTFLSAIHLDRREQFADEFGSPLPAVYGERRDHCKKLIERLEEYSPVLRDLVLTQWTIDSQNKNDVSSIFDQLSKIIS
jgi:predicted ATPase